MYTVKKVYKLSNGCYSTSGKNEAGFAVIGNNGEIVKDGNSLEIFKRQSSAQLVANRHNYYIENK